MSHAKGTKRLHPPVHHKERPDSGDAFFPDPAGGVARTKDDLANELAEEFVGSATSGETQSEAREREVSEEIGGPFVTTSGREEFARGTDRSNPKGATREPFPTSSSTKR